MNIEDERRGKWAVLLSKCASRHVTLYRFHQIQVNLISYCFLIDNGVVNWRIIQSRKVQRHARQLLGSVAGNSGNIFFHRLFSPIYDFLCQILFFCANGDNGDR